MKKITSFFIQLCCFPVELFRFTYHCWLYTFGMITYRVHGGHEDQPCIFCRGLDNGEIPRLMNRRIRYRNLWMAKLLHPELDLMRLEGKNSPVPVCHREGGYICLSGWVPVAAVVLGLAWFLALGALIWISPLIPDEVRQEISQVFF